MNINKYIRAYAGYVFAYTSYKVIFYTLSQICNQVDKIVANDNFLPDGIKDIATPHNYNTAKEIVTIIKTHGGQGRIVLRPSNFLSISVSFLYRIRHVISKVVKFFINILVFSMSF